jgi:hypothetical protein
VTAPLQPFLEQVVLHAHPAQNLAVDFRRVAPVKRIRQHFAHFQPPRTADDHPTAARIAGGVDRRKAADVAQKAVTYEVIAHKACSKAAAERSLHLTPYQGCAKRDIAKTRGLEILRVRPHGDPDGVAVQLGGRFDTVEI